MASCEYCGQPFEAKDSGRPRKFCSDSHRQLAYLQRRKDRPDMGYPTQQDVNEAIAAARTIPGGSYPSKGYDPLDREIADLRNEVVPYSGAVTAKAMVDWLRKGIATKALIEDTAGTILVPSDMATDIVTVARQSGVIEALASARPTSTNKHRAGLLSAATVGWGRLETGTSITDAAISVSSPGLDIDVHDVLALAVIGTDELDDSPESARAAIVEAVGIAIGEAADAAFAAGTGSGQPKGLSLAANVSRVPSGQKTAASASATPVTADVLGLPFKLPVRFRRNAVWLASTDAMPKLAALTYANGDALMPNVGQGIGPAGWPIYEVPGLPSMATSGTTDPSIWFVNLQAAYRVVDRGPITVQRLTQRYAELGQVGMIVKRRIGGDLVRGDACAVYTL